MSNTLAEPGVGASRATRRGLSAPGWMREPLLHFMILGAALFGIDHVIASRTDDPHTIVIDAKVDAEAIEVFRKARDRDPNDDELYALRKVWLDNEVLYREGIALGLDRGDKAIRERVIFKALSMVEAGVKLPAIDEGVLRAWFENNRQKYDKPARFDFDEAIIAGDRSEAGARAFAQALNAGAPGDVEADLRVFTGRPRDNVVKSYGADFATALSSATVGEWQAIQSNSGVRVIRLKSVMAPIPATFEELSAVVLQDWTDSVMAAERSAAVRTLAQKYTVKASPNK